MEWSNYCIVIGSPSPKESGRLHVPRQVKMGRWLGLPRREGNKDGKGRRGGSRAGGETGAEAANGVSGLVGWPFGVLDFGFGSFFFAMGGFGFVW